MQCVSIYGISQNPMASLNFAMLVIQSSIIVFCPIVFNVFKIPSEYEIALGCSSFTLFLVPHACLCTHYTHQMINKTRLFRPTYVCVFTSALRAA